MLKGYSKNNQINRNHTQYFLHQLNEVELVGKAKVHWDESLEIQKFLIFINLILVQMASASLVVYF